MVYNTDIYTRNSPLYKGAPKYCKLVILLCFLFKNDWSYT